MSIKTEFGTKMKKKICPLHTKDELPYTYATIKTELEAIGQTLDDADLLIASIAIANNATLVTNNKEHFRRIQGLKSPIKLLYFFI